MNKRLKALSCALVAIFALSIAVDSPKIGPFGVDAVSAATGVAPAKPTTPSKPYTPSKPTKSGNTSTSTTNYTLNVATKFTRTLNLGCTGSDVTFLQVRLSSYGYWLNFDGIYGNKTLLAVKDFQNKHGFKADGIASTNTLAKLTPKIIVKTTPTSILKLGSTDSDVKLLQSRLSSYGYKLNCDGMFGNLTLSAVKDFQSKHSLKADGIVGPLTIAKLFAIAVTPTKPVTPPVVKPPVVVVPPVVDVVTAASLVDNAAVFEKSIGKDGKWIIATTKDLTTTKDLLLEGEFKNGKKDAVTGAELIQRKIALYTQDDKRVVTARFTLTAPKLTIASPNASLEHGTFKGDLYITTANFKLIDTTVVGNVYVSATNFTLSKEAKIQGNVYFATQGAKDTFKILDTSSVTGKQDLQVVDAVTTASIVDNATAFEKAIGTEATGGKWIITSLGDITSTKDLVLDGKLLNGKKDAAGVALVQRKIGLYTQAKQDGKNVVTAKFTLTAPKLTIKSPEAKIQSSNFKGDLYVSSRHFLLTDSTVTGNVYVHSTEFTLSANAKIVGNVYFDNLEAQKTFVIEAGSSVTGTQTLLPEPSIVDSVSSASLVDNAADFEKAISKDGTWIICPVKDMVIDKDLVLEGTLYNKKTPPAIARKLGIYFHDDDQYTTAKFTLTVKSLTIKSPKATIQKGTLIGDLYIAAEGFTLKETKVIGNVYFATQAIKDAFKLDALSSITGTQTVKAN